MGVPLVTVQRILRHKDVRLTASTYGHLSIEDMREGLSHLPLGSLDALVPGALPAPIQRAAPSSHPVEFTGSRSEPGSHTGAPVPPQTTALGAPVARLGRGVGDWIGPAEVAARLKVSRATVYALVKSGELKHKRVGLQIRIALADLEHFLRR